MFICWNRRNFSAFLPGMLFLHGIAAGSSPPPPMTDGLIHAGRWGFGFRF